jgi:hypothetical protein
MTSNLLKYFVQLTVVIVLYYIFAQFDLEFVFLIIAVVVLVLFVVFNKTNRSQQEIYLEIACDAPKYLEKLEQKHKEDDDMNVYQLQQAYGLVFQGKYEETRRFISNVQFDQLDQTSKYPQIYTKVQAKLAYESKDEQELKRLLNIVVEQEEVDELTRDYIKVLILLLREEYEQAIALLMDTIPVQRTRVYIIELEYYLGFAYVQFEQLEDAKAVLEFVVKKGFRIIYTDLCYELYMKIKEE